MATFLRAGDEVDVVVLVLHLLHPLADGLGKVGVGLQPRRVEAQRHWGAVALVVLLQVLQVRGDICEITNL